MAATGVAVPEAPSDAGAGFTALAYPGDHAGRVARKVNPPGGDSAPEVAAPAASTPAGIGDRPPAGALHLRWRLAAAPDDGGAAPEQDVVASELAGRSGSLLFEGRATAGDDLVGQAGALAQREENWSHSSAVRGALARPGMFRLEFDGSVSEWRRPAEDDGDGFAFGPVTGWEKNAVSAANLALDLADGRARLTTRYAASQYVPPPPGFHSRGKKKKERDEDRERFSGLDVAQGSASLTRLEVTPWRGDGWRITPFAQYSSVDRLFEDLSLRDDKDPFAKPDRSTGDLGGEAAAGPLSLALWQSRERANLDGRAESPVTVTRRNHWRVALALDHPTLLGAADARVGAASLLPDSIWVDGDRGRVEHRDDRDAPDDRTSSLGAGASWSRGGLDLSLSLWSTELDSPAADGWDSADQSIEVSLGSYGATLDLYGGLSVGRYEYGNAAGIAADLGQDFYIGATVRPAHLPDLSGDLTFSRYLAEYVADGTAGRYDSWEFGLSLDFSKFFGAKADAASPRLTTSYRLKGVGNRDAYTGSDGEVDHMIAIMGSLPLGEPGGRP